MFIEVFGNWVTRSVVANGCLMVIVSRSEQPTKFLSCISKTKSVSHNAVIVSKDVKALFCCVPHTVGMKSFDNFMIENGFHSIKICNITKIIEFILAHNYFEFNDESYIQTHGIVMDQEMTHTCIHIYVEL